ncbi:MAG TPA: rod shape-determining protein [Verrucomicrobiota bacterium]|nr:rod shape-determining protein [Verrucomicrobiota bacterium]HNU50878.1 rod shape-determining protein [Verrucomicrobiota bacterium]
MRTTYVPPLTAETAKELQRRAIAPAAAMSEASHPAKGDVFLVGLDLGTNTSCLKLSPAGSREVVFSEIVPTVVGYAKEGIVENVLPGNAQVLFGEAAMKHRLYLRMLSPLANGVVADLAAAHDFARHLRQLLDVPMGAELRAVVGVPASADRAARENVCQMLNGFFPKVILVPEPFLAALGYRDEGRLGDPAYVDPVRNSMFVDIGAGTTDVCLVQGYHPTADDQVSVPFAGDKVDELLSDAIRRVYPDVHLSQVRIREVKEAHSYVGPMESPVTVDAVVGGKLRRLDLGEAIGDACQALLMKVFDCVKAMIGQASTDSVAEVMRNIILTGGGSRIRNIDAELQRLLVEDGYEKPRVQTVGEDYKEYVARGALAAGRQARENQWIALG